MKNFKRLILAALVAALIFSSAYVAVSAAPLGSGAAVIASEVTVVKTALLGETVEFSDSDIKCALGIPDFCSVTVNTLPSSTEGTLMLGERRVGEGTVIRRRNLSRLCFIPTDNSVTESSFVISVKGASEDGIKCIIRFVDKVNYAPKLNTDANQTLSVATQSGIGVYGKISAADPEGDALLYMTVRYPKHGTLSLDSETGDFAYTPNDGYRGKDSFVFTVRDEYGNYTAAETVGINVTKRMSEVEYVDMEKSPSYNAAVTMTAMGVMGGERIGDGLYFLPDGDVSRAEFVAMAMKALGIRADSSLRATYFDDNGDIPEPLVSYVATAARCGIVNGAFDGTALLFRPNDKITFTEAAIVLSNILEIGGDDAVFSELESVSALPVWARDEVGAVISAGIFDPETSLSDTLTRADAAECLYRAVASEGNS